MQIINTAGYKFVGMPDAAELLEPIQNRCASLELKGNVLLSPEGINFSVAGLRSNIDEFLIYLRSDPVFAGRLNDLTVKESISNTKPFGRMVVRLTKEIITMRHPMICPESRRAPAVEPSQLKEWLDKGHDDQGRPVVLIDARNKYEVEMGTFTGAIDLRIERFSEFPEAVKTQQEDVQDKTVVSFCTGGIRCEKAVLLMEDLGFKNVFQLEGGILRYFEEVGGKHWDGDCFVFDERVALDPDLKEKSQNYAPRGGGFQKLS